MKINVDIPKILGQRGRESGLLRKEIASGVGVKLCTYNSYLEGRAKPSLTMLIKICMFYKYHSLDDFLGLDEDGGGAIDFLSKYNSLPLVKKRIVDFILQDNC